MRSRLRNRLLLLTAGALIAGLVVAPGAAAQGAPTITTRVIADFSSPSWEYFNGRPAMTWRTDTGWPVASAPFGRGRDLRAVNTKLPQDGVQQSLATYFRKQIPLDGDLPEAMRIVTWADDGIIAYVNGVEVGRSNIDPGPLKAVTYANKAPLSKNARNSFVNFDVPVSVLHEGRNTIAFQVAANWKRSPNVTFAAQIVRTDRADAPTPQEPVIPSPQPTASPAPTLAPSPAPSGDADADADAGALTHGITCTSSAAPRRPCPRFRRQ